MSWWSRWGPYPGRGPWRHVPPPARPGWMYRGWCWWLRGYPYAPWPSKEEEVKYLEDLKKYLSEVIIKEIDERLAELKSKKE